MPLSARLEPLPCVSSASRWPRVTRVTVYPAGLAGLAARDGGSARRMLPAGEARD